MDLKRKYIPWKQEHEDDELEQLIYIVEHDWCWKFPGWKWVANKLNQEYGNNRTPLACRMKWKRWVGK